MLTAALLEDHAYCLTLLAGAPTEPLSAQQRADSVNLHRRMVWLLRTYFA